jgi:two-component sensor histidine kinase
MPKQSAEFDLDENGLGLLVGELNHRIRNLLMMIEAEVKQTHSTSVEDYRAKLIERITGLYGFCMFTSHYGRVLGLAQLLEQTVRPYSANGALSSPLGYVKIEWKIRHGPGDPRKLAIVWTELDGPEVKHPRHWGFGSRLIRTVLGGHGGVRLDFNGTGLACFMLVNLDRPDARVGEPAGALGGYDSQPHSHSMRY